MKWRRLPVFIFVCLLLAAIFARRADAPAVTQKYLTISEVSCARTYIARKGKRGDAIRCTACRVRFTDGSRITKEGC